MSREAAEDEEAGLHKDNTFLVSSVFSHRPTPSPFFQQTLSGKHFFFAGAEAVLSDRRTSFVHKSMYFARARLLHVI